MPTATDPIPGRIFQIRSHRVILDSDLARLYGVPTKRFNEAFKRNKHRFPEDFAFQLAPDEVEKLRSQIATSSSGHGGRRYLPWVFTEHGALMAANILRSERATEMSVYVVRAFVKQREALATNAVILKRLAEIDKTLLEHDSNLRLLWSRLQPLLSPPPAPPKPRIGFHEGNR
ncbi:MAG TPA: ORF6N domain-containing protein [Lacunisphaera sp.]